MPTNPVGTIGRAVGTVVNIAIAVGAGLAILWVGLFFLRAFATPLPEPPPAGELRKVKLTYRCEICGTEVRMTAATTETPDPPRHCQDDMTLVAPIDE